MLRAILNVANSIKIESDFILSLVILFGVLFPILIHFLAYLHRINPDIISKRCRNDCWHEQLYIMLEISSCSLLVKRGNDNLKKKIWIVYCYRMTWLIKIQNYSLLYHSHSQHIVFFFLQPTTSWNNIHEFLWLSTIDNSLFHHKFN